MPGESAASEGHEPKRGHAPARPSGAPAWGGGPGGGAEPGGSASAGDSASAEDSAGPEVGAGPGGGGLGSSARLGDGTGRRGGGPGSSTATWGGPAPWREEDLPPGTSERQRLEHAFGLAIRKAGSIMQLLGQAAADRIGITATDLNCLNILSLTGPITAGELAKRTGLTTASITGVVDRLEASGFVRRERDTHDRRRVVIYVILERAARDVAP